MFSSIVALITSLPQLISLLISGWKLIRDELTLLEKRRLLKDFTDSTKKAVETGNTGDLENIFRSGNT